MKKKQLIAIFICLCMVLVMFSVCAIENSTGFDGNIMLFCPTSSEVTVSVTANRQTKVSITCNGITTEERTSNIDSPANFVLDGLSPDSTYTYKVNYDGKSTEEYSFNTPKTEGNYSFVVQSDSHLLNKADKEMYQKSMDNMANFDPDFFISMGDDFLNDQIKSDPVYQDYNTIKSHYTQQLPYLSTVAKSAPFFCVMGNHEGEYGAFFDRTDKNLASMATNIRKTYYINPSVDDNEQNYYSYTWGDALYVMIDPYRYTAQDPYSIKDGWDWTLGKQQYDWFKNTLEQSNAKYKFVFSHHAIGNIRGGEQIAKLYEWGGCDKNGQYLFDEKRPGWGKPIQQIMKDSGVTIFFQGHDHLFARENVDGVVYQTLPKPAETVADQQSNPDAYPNADKLVNSGFVKVDVASEKVTVNYFRNYSMIGTDTGIVYSYTVDEDGNVNVVKGQSEDFSLYPSSIAGNDKPSAGEKPRKGDTENSKSGIKVLFNGRNIEFDVLPFIDENSRTQVPVRFIAESMGAKVLWEENAEPQTVTIIKDGNIIKLKIGEKQATVNGEVKNFDASCFVKDNRTFVPIRFISEIFGATVAWDENTSTVIVTTAVSLLPSAAATPKLSVREKGENFSFAVQADPHLDENSDGDVYTQTLKNIAAANPDFLIDLGDTFMTERHKQDAESRYILNKNYFSNLGDIPLLLAKGNHDGENGYDSTKNIASELRKKYFADYSVMDDANYYSFNSGDALFIILDPFAYTMDRTGKGGGWAMTLGTTQYDWLKNTLETSDSKYKFVFIHNLISGAGNDTRGGANSAKFYEWGGYNEAGIYEFDKMRPGWDMPIHDLLVKNDVDVVFHGHDHFYAKEEKDGIIYQLVPQPSILESEIKNAAEYGYSEGTLLPPSGYIKVSVTDEMVNVDYIKTSLNDTKESIIDTYTVK